MILFAALAAVVLFQLYSVLGRRVGRQPEDNASPAAVTPPAGDQAPVLETPVPDEVAGGGLAALKARDSSFELLSFLNGARTAYQKIVEAFAAGDRETLKDLLSPPVMAAFEGEIARRETEGRTEAVEFLQIPRADLEKALVEGEKARLTVRFLGELRSRTKGPEGEGVEDRRTAELWTFERSLDSRNPNWILVQVGAAEA
jgi:predicted lipid-binding transport protein (Tim44 family)